MSMRKVMIVFATIVLLTLTTFAEKPNYAAKMRAMASVALSESLPISPTPDSCTCSCGKDCDGSCTAHVEGCGLGDGIRCIIDCCSRAPGCGDLQ